MITLALITSLRKAKDRNIQRLVKIFEWPFKFKYPKTLILVLSIVLAYYLFKHSFFANITNPLNNWGYLGAFIAGLFFSFGFTTPIAVAFFISLNPDNIYLAALFGGFGALISDLIIFKTIKFSFTDEFNSIKNLKPVKEASSLIKNNIHIKINQYLLFIFAGIIIASPLPDEIGVSMLAGLTSINEKYFIILSLIFNFIGILLMLMI